MVYWKFSEDRREELFEVEKLRRWRDFALEVKVYVD